MKKTSFHEVLYRIVQEKEYTNTELAKRINSNRHRIAGLLDGSSEPASSEIESLCEEFGVSADYLLGRSYSDTPDSSIEILKNYFNLSQKSTDIISDFLNNYNHLPMVTNQFFEYGYFSRIIEYIDSLNYFKNIYDNCCNDLQFNVANNTKNEIENKQLEITKNKSFCICEQYYELIQKEITRLIKVFPFRKDSYEFEKGFDINNDNHFTKLLLELKKKNES